MRLSKLSFIVVCPMMSLGLSFIYPNSFLAHAQYITGPTASAMGGAGVAAVTGSDSVFLNPAAIAHAPKFEGSIFYQDGYQAHNNHRTYLGAHLMDNSDDVLVPGALSYAQGARMFPGGVSSEDQLWQVSMGGFVHRNFAIGASAYWLNRDIHGQEKDSSWSGTIGAHYTVNQSLAFGLVYYDPVSRSERLPLQLRLEPKVRFGVQYEPQSFVRLRLDVARQERDNPQKDGIILTGLEVDAQEFLVFRMGAEFNDYEKRNSATLGLGFVSPRLRINYAVQKPLKGEGGALHTVDFRLPSF